MHFFNSSSRTPGQQPHQLPNLTNSIHALLSKKKVNAPASVFKLIEPAFQLTTLIVQHKAQDFFLALCTKHLRPANLAGETDFDIPEILYRGREAKALTPRDRETVKDLFDRLVDHVDSINIASHDERHVYGCTKSFLDPTTARKSSEIFVSAHVVMRIAEATMTLRADPKNTKAAASRLRHLLILALTILHEIVHAAIWMQGLGSWQALEDELTDTPDRVRIALIEPLFENDDHNEMGDAFENFLLGGKPSCRVCVPDCGGEVLTLAHPKQSRRALDYCAKTKGLFVSHDAVKAATVDEVWGVVDDNSIARLFSKGYWQDAEAEGCGKIDLEIVACATMFGSNGPIRTQWKPGKDRYWTQGVTLFPDVENTVLSRYKKLRDLHDVQGE